MEINHYVNNEQFLLEMIAYKKLVKESISNSKGRPRVPDYIGSCLFKIATHLSRKPNFANYTFKEDMISDGVENCLLYIDNFDSEKSKNPFAYFTQIIYFAFLRRIQKEKKHMYIKYKCMENEIVNALIENNGEDIVASHMQGMMHESYSENFIREFIETFEDTQQKKKTKNIEKRKGKKGEDDANANASAT